MSPHWVNEIVADLSRNAVMLSRSEVRFQKTYTIDPTWDVSFSYQMRRVKTRLPHLYIEWRQQGLEVVITISKLMSPLDWLLEDELTHDPSAAHP